MIVLILRRQMEQGNVWTLGTNRTGNTERKKLLLK